MSDNARLDFLKKSAEIFMLRSQINAKIEQLSKSSPHQMDSIKKNFGDLELLIDEIIPVHNELYEDLQSLAGQKSLIGPFKPDSSSEVDIEFPHAKESMKRSGYKSNFYNKIPVIRTGK
jgi:hypothetical protein